MQALRYGLLLLLLAAIGMLDYATGYEASFAVFYLIPVVSAAWLAGRRAGIVFAVLSALFWMLADHFAGHAYSHRLFYYWNGANRLAIGVAAALATAAIRRTLLQQKALIIDLRRAVLSLSELSAHLPHCPICHSFRDDRQYKSEFDRFVGDQSDPRAFGKPCPHCLTTRAEHFRPQPTTEPARH